MRVLAIDPGPTDSAYALIDATPYQMMTDGYCNPLSIGKEPNADMRELIRDLAWNRGHTLVAIEMVASYGMAVGADVFDTCVWIGRFIERAQEPVELVYRRDVKLHHCHSAKAKDANITQALIDRFAPGQPNRGKGTKANPGWFHGFKADVWQAYALAVYIADREGERT